MKLYVVKNDYGKLWDYDHSYWSNSIGGNYTSGKSYAEDTVDFHGGHVVELVEKPEPVEVSEEEAEMLESLKDGDLMPIGELSYFIGHAEQLTEKESIKREDRLMHAYVNGWTVKKPKRYIVMMRLPGGKGPDDNVWHYMRAMRSQQGDYIWWSFADADGTCKSHRNDAFTAAEIDHYGLQACAKVEVTDDE